MKLPPHLSISFCLKKPGAASGQENPASARQPAAYASTPEGFPNPFTGEKLGTVDFDLDLSKSRYNVVNSLFE